MLRKIKSKLRPLKRLYYIGNRRRCPLCKSGLREFHGFGIIPRKDAKCPVCETLERHRLFWLYIERLTDFHANPPLKALHIVPETILEEKFRSLIGGGYYTADLSMPDVDLKMDIMNIKLPDNSFNFIYCSHVLEHVSDDRKAMREFYRILSVDGLAVLLVPITAESTFEDPSIKDPQERLRIFGQADHVRRYGPDYLSRLEEAGFIVEKIDRRDFLTADEIEKMGITSAAGELYICRK
ncbi:MAG: methyltransferase domain-containing protein [Verrucomicrobiota bacterium]